MVILVCDYAPKSSYNDGLTFQQKKKFGISPVYIIGLIKSIFGILFVIL